MTQAEVDELVARARTGQIKPIGVELPQPPQVVFEVRRPTVLLSRWRLANANDRNQRSAAETLDDALRTMLASRYGADVLTEEELGDAILPADAEHPIYRIDPEIVAFEIRSRRPSAADTTAVEVRELEVRLIVRPLMDEDARPSELTYDAHDRSLPGRFNEREFHRQITDQLAQDRAVEALFPKKY